MDLNPLKYFKKASPSSESDSVLEAEALPEESKPGKSKIRQVDVAFNDAFVLGRQEVEKKLIMNVIRGKISEVAGQDFYYAYTYENGVLKYIATKSDKHLTGAASVFVRAWFEEGNFVYKAGRRYFMVTSENGKFEWSVNPELPIVPFVEVTDDRTILPAKAPASLLFQWSLTKRHIMTELVLAGALVLALVFNGISMASYNAIQKKADDIKRQQAAMTSAPKPLTATLDLAEIITELSNKLTKYDGKIYQIKVGKEGIVSAVTFPNENYTRMFLEHNGGGKYEDGKVLLGFNMPGAGNGNAGAQSGEKQKGSGDPVKPADPQAGGPEPKAEPGK